MSTDIDPKAEQQPATQVRRREDLDYLRRAMTARGTRVGTVVHKQ